MTPELAQATAELRDARDREHAARASVQALATRVTALRAAHIRAIGNDLRPMMAAALTALVDGSGDPPLAERRRVDGAVLRDNDRDETDRITVMFEADRAKEPQGTWFTVTIFLADEDATP